MYDVIIVGARVAGSATALLLARRGLRVLVLDRARFPSDTLSTHQLQVPGVARLARWGVLPALLDAGTPPTKGLRFDQAGTAGSAAFTAPMPEVDGTDFMLSPRRTLLDAVLVAAARTAGAEVREDTAVTDLATGADGRVTGVHAVTKGGAAFAESARLVVGADGKHSVVAKAVGAAEYRARPPLSMAYYTYWSGVGTAGLGEVYGRPGRAVGLWPTNDGLVLSYIAWPAARFNEFRSDVEGHVMSTLDDVGVGERFRAATRAERFRGSPDLPNVFRRPYGPGWALVGDAGLVLDPITGQGMTHALRDAEALSAAIASGLDGGSLERELRAYHRTRDRETKPMAGFTARLAALSPPRPGEIALFQALQNSPDQAALFVGVLTGAVPLARLMSPPALVRLLGLGGALRLMSGR